MPKKSPTQKSLSRSRSKSRSKSHSKSRSKKSHIVSFGHSGSMGTPSGRGVRKHHTRKNKNKNKKKRKTRYCRCKKPCTCTKKCSCRKKHTKKHTRRTGQRGGTTLLHPSNYPNPFPKGGPVVPGSLDGGIVKKYYNTNTNPYLPNPKSTNSNFKQEGGGFFNLAENVPGGTDILDSYWKGVTGTKNIYQSWIGGEQYVSPSPSVQPSLDAAVNIPYSPIDIPTIVKQSQLKAAVFK